MKLKLKHKKTEESTICLSELTSNALEYAKLAYEQEERREDSLINQATQMTTYFSFVSVFILMIIPFALEDEIAIPKIYVAIISIVIITLLIVSMFLAVLVQWRYKYQALPAPIDTFDHIIENAEYFKTQEQRDKSFIESLQATWKSKRIINDRRAILLRLSMIFFFSAIALLLLATFFGIYTFIIV